ncbi:uncharacterized protein MONOS_7577 [Monocercomonoides exilis]|uniref:uncharacterized protein n=1 Tax=Monocercomonoides exilis TaxID=2049356 RepID=UPI00355A371D|nr:hypothetical protein MONOS_7577 [Monocercomonoides exilis]|eukprot:MONOS_7577.1-p1 / transcript=MONOS_7577.1 / gene=MONOS_7577 / organism=Monocercomonoides_exilis_PA203 / gene_product=unspecified product / transcript_product=unspecified product / location=Mono_scaffold00262:24844-25518(-) / protein_length=180 / sequence_SO=supercontig / SO=protein_coding / is_pseudo=false
MRKGRLAGKVGKFATAMEHVKNNECEDSSIAEDSMCAVNSLVKLSQKLNAGTKKILAMKRLTVLYKSVFKPWCKTLDPLHESYHHISALIVNVDESSTRVPTTSYGLVICKTDTKAGFTKEPPRMINSTFVADVAADGYAFPFVILWPSLKLPEELKSLLSPTLEIWANESSWINNVCL